MSKFEVKGNVIIKFNVDVKVDDKSIEKVINLLKSSKKPLTFDEILSKTKLTIPELQKVLTILTEQNKIVQLIKVTEYKEIAYKGKIYFTFEPLFCYKSSLKRLTEKIIKVF